MLNVVLTVDSQLFNVVDRENIAERKEQVQLEFQIASIRIIGGVLTG
jgi:hypothetical protein